MAGMYDELPFNEGEKEMHDLLHVPTRENPTSLYLTPWAANMVQRSPLLALGTLDEEGRPWTTVWGGEMGFARPVAEGVIGVKTTVDRVYDPVVQILMGKEATGEVVRHEKEPMVSGLAIDLEARRRVKLYGKMMGGVLAATEEGVGEVQLVVHIEQIQGNCPKYLNKKHIVPALPRASLLSNSLPLPPEALALLAKADLFFISSSDHDLDMDTNHRGGPPGFVRVTSNEKNECILVYPEYSGNRLYQTLGNLRNTPKAGLVFPDFDNGDVLYVTGRTEIFIGKDANALLPHSNLAVKITLDAARFVKQGLALKGIPGEFSPYNPPVRLLKDEQKNGILRVEKARTAKLLKKEALSPSITRYRFQIQDLSPLEKGIMTWKAGQYVALSFENELSMGYSHMRDDDPESLNDDYLRTFTVSSAPSEDSEFEITVRTHGPVTNFLLGTNSRTHLEIPLLGFGGEFFIEQAEDDTVAFIAGGVGITPVLAQAASLDLDRFKLFWTVRSRDVDMVVDTMAKFPELSKATTLFVTGKGDHMEKVEELRKTKMKIETRRMSKEDFQTVPKKVYLCASPLFRKKLLEWLPEKEVVFEDFGY